MTVEPIRRTEEIQNTSDWKYPPRIGEGDKEQKVDEGGKAYPSGDGSAGGEPRPEVAPRTQSPKNSQTKLKGIPREGWRGGNPPSGGTRLFDPVVEVEGTNTDSGCDPSRPERRSG